MVSVKVRRFYLRGNILRSPLYHMTLDRHRTHWKRENSLSLLKIKTRSSSSSNTVAPLRKAVLAHIFPYCAQVILEIYWWLWTNRHYYFLMKIHLQLLIAIKLCGGRRRSRMDTGDFNGTHHYRNLSTGSLFGSSAERALRSTALHSKKPALFLLCLL